RRIVVEFNDDRVVLEHGTGQRVRVDTDTVTAADHEGVGSPVGKSETRSKQFLADLYSQIGRVPAEPPELHQIGLRVVALHSAVGAGHHWVVFPARAIRDRQLAPHLPFIAYVEAVFPLTG